MIHMLDRRVYVATDPTGPRGTIKGIVTAGARAGLVLVQWDSGEQTYVHESELREES